MICEEHSGRDFVVTGSRLACKKCGTSKYSESEGWFREEYNSGDAEEIEE